MTATYFLWGLYGLALLLGTYIANTPLAKEQTEQASNYYLSIEAISQKAYTINDPGNNSELYFVYGSALSDGTRSYHTSWTHTSNLYIELASGEYQRERVPIISDQVLKPSEYMVLNIGIMDQDCEATSRRRIARFFIPEYGSLPEYTPTDQGHYTTSWARMSLEKRGAPDHDLRRKVLPPIVDLNGLEEITRSQCRFSSGDDLQGYFSIIAWNDPYAPPESPMWDYHCYPAMCHAPYTYTADTLMINTRHDDIQDITFRVTLEPR